MTSRHSQILRGTIFLVLLLLLALLVLIIFLYYTFDQGQVQPFAEQVVDQTITQAGFGEQQTIIPEEGLESRTYRFEYGCQDYLLTLPVYRSKYEYFSTLDKNVYGVIASQTEMEEKYYTQFLLAENDQEMIDLIISEVRNQTGANTSDELAAALISFVQFMEYDCNKLFSYQNAQNNDYTTNYPYETLYLNTGVCGDTSILLGKLLKRMGYGAAFLIFENQNHMALGIQCPLEHANYNKDGQGYCYVETTAPSRIGVKPQEISQSSASDSHRVIIISEGKTFQKMNQLADQMKADSDQYGSYILGLSTCTEISRYAKIQEMVNQLYSYEESLSDLEDEISPMYENLEYAIQGYEQMGCEGKVSEGKYEKCQEEYQYLQYLDDNYQAKVDDYNKLVDEYNLLYENYLGDVQSFDQLIATTRSSCSGITYGGEALERIRGVNE